MIEAEIPVNAKIINKILTILSICSVEKKKQTEYALCRKNCILKDIQSSIKIS